MRFAICLLAAAAALVLAGSAGAGQSYMDSSGEVPGSADISGVSVTSDPAAGTFTFQVQTNWPAWDANTFFAILVDADQNASTGTAGFDYVVTGDRFGGTVVNTTHPLVVPATSSSLSNGLWTVTVNASQIGNPQALSFFVLTQVGPDQRNPYEDRAPDTGTWSYSLLPPAPAPAPLPPPPTISSKVVKWSGVPVHGKALRVLGLTVGLSDGTKSRATDLACTATLAARHLAGIGAGGCTFRLPKAAKGRRLVVRVAGTWGGAPVSRTYALRVR